MFKSQSILCTAFLATTLASTACGSDAPGTDAAVAFLEPTLENIQEHIFDVACVTACHTSESPAGGLDLSSADASFLGLVSIPVVNSVASQNGWLLVKPGDPELSFLVRKIGLPGLGEGGPMPFTMKISPFYQDLIMAWIEAGATR